MLNSKIIVLFILFAAMGELKHAPARAENPQLSKTHYEVSETAADTPKGSSNVRLRVRSASKCQKHIVKWDLTVYLVRAGKSTEMWAPKNDQFNNKSYV